MLAPQDGGDNTLDIGSVDAGDLGSRDKLWSRIGVKSSTELDGGMTAGLHLEKRLDNFRTRHQNVWLSGAFGKVTLGQQGSPYHSHTAWDNSNLFGNWNPFTGSRLQGISYASNLGGPFNFSALVTDDNMADGGGGNGSGLDTFEVGGTLSAGPVNLGAGYQGSDGADLMGGKVGGSLAGVGWALAFESMTTDSGAADANRYGFNLEYSTTDGRAYVYYEDMQPDNTTDRNYLLLGYSHTIGPGVVVIAEYQLPSDDSNPERSAVAVRVDF